MIKLTLFKLILFKKIIKKKIFTKGYNLSSSRMVSAITMSSVRYFWLFS